MGSLVKKGIVKGKRGRIKIKDQGNIAPTVAVWEKYQTEYYHDSSSMEEKRSRSRTRLNEHQKPPLSVYVST